MRSTWLAWLLSLGMTSLMRAQTPLEVQAGWVRALAVVLPSTFGIRGFLQLAEMGANLHQSLRSWPGLWVQVVVYWGLAWLILRRKRRAGDQ